MPTRIRPTALAVIASGIAGLVIGTAATSAIVTANVPAPRVETVTVSQPCERMTEWATTTLAQYDMILTAWENGTAYSADIRDKNYTAVAYQFDQIDC